jgi:hypothetical protein
MKRSDIVLAANVKTATSEHANLPKNIWRPILLIVPIAVSIKNTGASKCAGK